MLKNSFKKISELISTKIAMKITARKPTYQFENEYLNSVIKLKNFFHNVVPKANIFEVKNSKVNFNPKPSSYKK